ncbi:MAG: hypothetical protein ACN2B6_01190 [Rickettsiales bacterium]
MQKNLHVPDSLYERIEKFAEERTKHNISQAMRDAMMYGVGFIEMTDKGVIPKKYKEVIENENNA